MFGFFQIKISVILSLYCFLRTLRALIRKFIGFSLLAQTYKRQNRFKPIVSKSCKFENIEGCAIKKWQWHISGYVIMFSSARLFAVNTITPTWGGRERRKEMSYQYLDILPHGYEFFPNICRHQNIKAACFFRNFRNTLPWLNWKTFSTASNIKIAFNFFFIYETFLKF